jgi:hypothetical protein
MFRDLSIGIHCVGVASDVIRSGVWKGLGRELRLPRGNCVNKKVLQAGRAALYLRYSCPRYRNFSTISLEQIVSITSMLPGYTLLAETNIARD